MTACRWSIPRSPPRTKTPVESSSRNATTAAAQGYAVLSNCAAGNQNAINALAGTKVYVDCSSYKGDGTFNNATTIVFPAPIELLRPFIDGTRSS